MARNGNGKKTYELSDAEQRDLITLIREGKPLPERYRFILFEDKREVELVWNGKTRDVCTTVLPFQSLEHVDEPRTETKLQGDLFDGRGRQQTGWTNKLIWGDNKLILSSLKAGSLRQQIEDAGGLKLIYIDPPFDVGADFSMDVEVGGETFHKEPNLLEQIAYRDTWGRGADSFIAMIYERIVLMRDLLAIDGNILVHCDWRVNAYVRTICDEVFGKENQIGEIIWQRTNARSGDSRWPRIHDTIHHYAKAPGAYFKSLTVKADAAKLPHTLITGQDGLKYQTYELTAPGTTVDGESGKPWRGFHPSKMGRHWGNVPSVMDEWDRQGLIHWPKEGGWPRRRAETPFVAEDRTTTVGDVWIDIDRINQASKERLGYDTQKPEVLLHRILESVSKPGDLVADFFCGSGTIAAVAEKHGRKWIATDLGKFATHTTRKRLIGVQRELKAAEKPFRAFEVLNLGRYERQAYLNVGGRLTGPQKAQALVQKEREFRELILRAYKATEFGDGAPTEDGFFHGSRNGRLVVIGPINLPVGRLFVEEVITECRKRGATRADILAFEFEMGLFPAVLEEARAKGIDLAPKYIPAEVFDKRAVDKGQVVFHDISFVEARPVYDKKRKLTMKIELADFSVYYTQGDAEKAIAAMKDGKNGVILERGQLYKVAKDKNGVVSKEALTKQWTDWVDYWAVDFDYMSLKEIIRKPIAADGPTLNLPGVREDPAEFELPRFEQQWTGAYIFENEWQSFRTRQSRDLELITAEHTYDKAGRYTVAVKVIDIFGNDTMTLVPVNVG